MTDSAPAQRDEQGNWRPAEPIRPAPINHWPLNARALRQWFFGWPGFLWPYNAVLLLLTVVTWVFLTPELQAMESLEVWWLGALFARNVALVLLVFGGLHFYLYIRRGQGDELQFSSRPFAVDNRRFRFGHQVRDNMFHTLAYAVPVFTAFEALTYWGFANGLLGYGVGGETSVGFWLWSVFLFLLAPIIHAVHFYFGHRLLHSRFLYRRVHALHHRNVDVGPWSGLSMHPLEHTVYFSTVVVQWLLALHPLNALYQIQLAVVYAAFAHTGFEKLKVSKSLGIEGGSYFHNLHHKHFECNYGGSLIPLDRIFGTFHDGSSEADAAMRERIEVRRKALRAQLPVG